LFEVCVTPMAPGVDAFEVPPGVVPNGGAATALGAGVDGGLATVSGSDFGFILVIRKEIFAPDIFGSHSRKLYEGKCSRPLFPSSNEKTSGR
jgi:hypothetical protein